MEFGEKVKILRKKKHISQAELAERLGVALRTVRGWEIDGRRPKQAALYDRLSEELGYDRDLLRDDSDLFFSEETGFYGSRVRQQTEKIVNDLKAIFAGGALSEDDQDTVMRVLNEAYFEAKKVRKQYKPFRFEDDSE